MIALGVDHVIAGMALATLTVSVAVPVPPALVTPMVTEKGPVAVGVPVMAPVAVSTARPAGRPVAE